MCCHIQMNAHVALACRHGTTGQPTRAAEVHRPSHTGLLNSGAPCLVLACRYPTRPLVRVAVHLAEE